MPDSLKDRLAGGARTLSRELLDLKLRDVLRGVKRVVGPRPVAPDARRVAGAQLKPLSADYLKRRTVRLQALVAQVLRSTAPLGEQVSAPDLADLDERVVEYAAAAALLRDQAARLGRPLQVLDVGCVLNSPIMADALRELTGLVTFLNPSPEPLVLDRNVAYVLGDMRSLQLPEGCAFDLVTCLSVLEHVDMDNTRYGDAASRLDHRPEHPEQGAYRAAASLRRFVRPGGRLLLSVPFGPFEYVFEYGKPNAPIYYSFDERMIDGMLQLFADWSCELQVFKLADCWQPTAASDPQLRRYAEGCAGAGAVALISAQAPGGPR